MTDNGAWLTFGGKVFLSTELEELAALAERWPDAERLLPSSNATLEREYVRLFLSPDGAPCPPWQSAHEGEKQLMGPAHHSALAWYRQAGVEPNADNEPADHIGLLLLFAAHLIEAGGAVDLFAGAHLTWVPEFCREVAKEARLDFYRAVATRTAQTIEAMTAVAQ